LQLLFTLALIVIFNLDTISSTLKLDFTKPFEIQVDELTQENLVVSELWEKQGLILTDQKSNLTIQYNGGAYEVSGAVSINLQAKIYGLLLQSHQQMILNESHPSVAEFVLHYNAVPVTFDQSIDPLGLLRENLIFVLLTSIYFMMLNFISVNSNEIIQEKTSNILEFILTSVTPFQHFCAKIITGLTTVAIQLGLSAGVFGVLLLQRLTMDQGRGLFDLANKYFSLESNKITFELLQELFNLDSSLMMKAGLALVFLILGLVILQVLILILSAKVKTIEEAASIQGPFYLGLLALYYLSLILNTPQQLAHGLGYVLSFVPISSMLLMGMRILSGPISVNELSLSLLMSLLALVMIIGIGYKGYQKGLVNE